MDAKVPQQAAVRPPSIAKRRQSPNPVPAVASTTNTPSQVAIPKSRRTSFAASELPSSLSVLAGAQSGVTPAPSVVSTVHVPFKSLQASSTFQQVPVGTMHASASPPSIPSSSSRKDAVEPPKDPVPGMKRLLLILRRGGRFDTGRMQALMDCFIDRDAVSSS